MFKTSNLHSSNINLTSKTVNSSSSSNSSNITSPLNNSKTTTEQKKKILKEFVDIVNEIRNHQVTKNGSFMQPITMQNARKFLSARKFELQRALALYKAHEIIRLREGLFYFDLNSENLRNELFSEKFTVLPNRDPVSGCCITLFSAYKHNPIKSSHRVTLQNIVLQLDVCISSIETQNNGILFIYNMKNSKYENFDYELCQKILALLKGAYPAKLKKVLIITPPLWFKAPFKVLQVFLQKKLRDRVFMLNQSQLKKHLPSNCLPTELGGHLEIDHSKWMNYCLEQIKLINLENKLDNLENLNDLNKSFMFNCDLIGDNSYSYDTEDDKDDFPMNSSELDLTGLSEQLTGLCDELATNFEQDFGIKLSNDENVKVVNLPENKSESIASINSNNSTIEIIQPLFKTTKPKPENIPIVHNNCDQLNNEKFVGSLNGSGNILDDNLLNILKAYIVNNPKSLHLSTDPGLHLNEFIQYLREKGRKGLQDEYDRLRKMKDFNLIYNNIINLKEFFLNQKEEHHFKNINFLNELDVLKLNSKRSDNYIKLMNGFSFKNSLINDNLIKNRYTDVLCYDHSRVTLKIKNQEKLSDVNKEESAFFNTDYINANYVDGYEQKNTFISTQGPLNYTCVDFWEMCIQNDVKVIVMTTRTMETNRIKCSQYWPLQLNSCLNFGYLTITNNSVQKFQDYVITKLTIKDNTLNKRYNITHMQFLSWPDYGVPHSACAMLEFRQKVRNELNDILKQVNWPKDKPIPPIVVHCSAGIGRTGTFITLDISILRLEATGLINILSTVEKIRSQRAYSIQMPDQYVFCYLALLEYALLNNMLENVDLSGFKDSESDLEN